MMRRSLLRRLRKETIPTPLDFSRQCIVPDGRNSGSPYDADSHQVQRMALEEAATGITKLTIVKPVQDGGSLIALILLFWCAIVRHMKVIIAYPTQESAEDIWLTKLAPALRFFKDVIPDKGAGSMGGVGRVMPIIGGGAFLVRTAGGTKESQSASVTGEAVLEDELDDWPTLDRARAMARRIEETDTPLVIQVSTVKRQDNSIILAEYEAGSQGRAFYKCPSCGEHWKLEWEQCKWEEKDSRLVDGSEHILCTKNGGILRGDQRRILLRSGILVHAGQTVSKAGVVSGERKSPRHTSILWWRGESPRRTLSSLIESYLEARAMYDATGDHGPMKRFYHDYLCRPYDLDVQELNTEGPLKPSILAGLSARSQMAGVDYKSDFIGEGATAQGLHAYRIVLNIPDEVEAVFAGVDVQANRCYWVLVGANRQAQEFDLGWGQEWARVDQRAGSLDEMYLLFDRVAGRMRHLSGEFPFTVGAIDAGSQIDLVRKWAFANRPQWHPIRGDTHSVKTVEDGDIEGISYMRDGLIFVHVDNVRDGLQAAYRRPQDAPGAIILPSGLTVQNNGYFKHLCKRQTIVVDKKNRKKDVLLNPGREDWLDSRIYARAMVLGWLAAVGQEHRERIVTGAATIQSQVQQTQRITSAIQSSEETGPIPQFRQPQPYRIGGNIPQRNLISRNRQWRR